MGAPRLFCGWVSTPSELDVGVTLSGYSGVVSLSVEEPAGIQARLVPSASGGDVAGEVHGSGNATVTSQITTGNGSRLVLRVASEARARLRVGVSRSGPMAGSYGILVKATGVGSVRLNKYFSGQDCVELLKKEFGDVVVYLIPKKNATVRGPWEWKQMLKRFVDDPQGYLREYFKRNQSESGFSEDKRRFGWKVAQKREDRTDTADLCTMLWHNLFWLK